MSDTMKINIENTSWQSNLADLEVQKSYNYKIGPTIQTKIQARVVSDTISKGKNTV